MFNTTSKYFTFFNNKPPASWVVHTARDFLTCYSCSYYSFMIKSLNLVRNNKETYHTKVKLFNPIVRGEEVKISISKNSRKI